MEIDILSGFWLVTSAALIVGFIIDQHPSVPNVWQSLLRWGKMRVGVVRGPRQFYEVPKRWFQHFYLVGTAVTGSLLVLLVCKLRLGLQWPQLLSSLLEFLQYPVVYTDTNAVPVTLVLTLETVQVVRRCYETFFVNVFSRKATMTLLHYGLGVVYYMSIGLTVLTGTNFKHLRIPDSIPMVDWVVYGGAVSIFILASLLQHQSFRILAALRTTNTKDKTPEQSGYSLPTGGMFDLVSCPHFFAEVVVYFSFCLIFSFRHTVVLSLFVFVLVNQVIAAVLSHQWYCQHFPQGMENRCAIIPHLL